MMLLGQQHNISNDVALGNSFRSVFNDEQHTSQKRKTFSLSETFLKCIFVRQKCQVD